jgi:hypothetical protein
MRIGQSGETDQSGGRLPPDWLVCRNGHFDLIELIVDGEVTFRRRAYIASVRWHIISDLTDLLWMSKLARRNDRL